MKTITIDTEYIVRIKGKVTDEKFFPLDWIKENTDPEKLKELIKENIDSELEVDVSSSKRVVEETEVKEMKDTRVNIEKGDKVKMNDRYYVSSQNRDEIFKVTSNPFMLCGTLVVGIERCWDGEPYGTYAADGLTKVEEE